MSRHRPERVGDLIRAELARLLRDQVRDPRVGFVTLTDVRLSPDLKYARVFLTVLGEDSEPTLKALGRATPFLRRELARTGGLKHVPELTFLIDQGVERGQRVEELLGEIGEIPDAEPEGDDGSPEEGGEGPR